MPGVLRSSPVLPRSPVEGAHLEAMCVGKDALRLDKLLFRAVDPEALHDVHFPLSSFRRNLVAGTVRLHRSQLVSYHLPCKVGRENRGSQFLRRALKRSPPSSHRAPTEGGGSCFPPPQDSRCHASLSHRHGRWVWESQARHAGDNGKCHMRTLHFHRNRDFIILGG